MEVVPVFTLFTLELLGTKKTTCQGHLSRGCPAGAVHSITSHPLFWLSPFWEPTALALALAGSRVQDGDQERTSGLEMWPQAGPAQPSPGATWTLQKSLFFPLGPQLSRVGCLGGTVSSPSPTSQSQEMRGSGRGWPAPRLCPAQSWGDGSPSF